LQKEAESDEKLNLMSSLKTSFKVFSSQIFIKQIFIKDLFSIKICLALKARFELFLDLNYFSNHVSSHVLDYVSHIGFWNKLFS